MESPQPGAEYRSYRAVLAAAARCAPSAWTFKSDPMYREILEHVSPEQGEAYLALVKEEFSHLWAGPLRWQLRQLARDNDRVGAPVVAFFPDYDLLCSPTNLRYLYHALRVLSTARQSGLAHHFIELGAGYGGLSFYIQALCALLDVEVLSYTTIDVPEAVEIQRMFAQEQEFNIVAVDGTDRDQVIRAIDSTAEPQGSRFLISAYAFSEFTDDVQAWYSDLVVRHCDHGFLVWNLRPLYRFTGKAFRLETERPLTGQGNFYVSF